MEKMNMGNDEALRVMAFKGWVEFVNLEKQERETSIKLKEAQDKASDFMAKQTEGTRSVMQRMLESTDSGLVGNFFAGWKEVVKEEKAAAELEALMSSKSAQLAGFSSRNKLSAMTATSRAAELQETETIAFCVCLWKRQTRVERTRRYGQQKNEKRRNDLIGVKNSFQQFCKRVGKQPQGRHTPH